MSQKDSDQSQGATAPEQNVPDNAGAEFAQAGAPAEQAASPQAEAPRTEGSQPAGGQSPDNGPDDGPNKGTTTEQAGGQTAAPGPQGEGTGQAETDPAGTGQATAEHAEAGQQPKPAGKRWNLPPAPGNPYLAGVFLGLTLLASYLILGAGLGASGALARLGAVLEHAAAPAHTLASAYFGRYFPDPLHYYLVFMFVGIVLGGALSALTGARFRPRIERGPTAKRLGRLGLALVGGALSGFAARLAHGCTSGQGLSGGALLLTGSMVFLACVFTAGYLTAWIFGRQWK